MGKTFRRGGSERGYSSPVKSLRDKRQRGSNRTNWEVSNYDKSKRSHNKPKPANEYRDVDGNV